MMAYTHHFLYRLALLIASRSTWNFDVCVQAASKEKNRTVSHVVDSFAEKKVDSFEENKDVSFLKCNHWVSIISEIKTPVSIVA